MRIYLLGLMALSTPARQDSIVHERNVAVPMRDGVILRADLLRPRGPGPFPVLVYRTPYAKDRAVERYPIFRAAAARGYAVVAQDVRGRYASEGVFDPYRQEGRDGYDTIEWAAHTGRLETESAEMDRATITIHHGPDHPSRLVLPVLP